MMINKMYLNKFLKKHFKFNHGEKVNNHFKKKLKNHKVKINLKRNNHQEEIIKEIIIKEEIEMEIIKDNNLIKDQNIIQPQLQN